MKNLLAEALGEKPADFVIKNARIANVYTLEYESADVAVCGDRIAGVGEGYEGRNAVDAGGKVLIPGMIDGHLHIESSMLAPPAFADRAVMHGTTAVMADPHEIANVLGMNGIKYMFETAKGLPVDVFLGAPPCVPASGFESPFEPLGTKHIHEMFERGWCTHLAEAMNFPGVIIGDDDVWEKLQTAGAGNVLTGHAPGVLGKALCAYMLGGISSDHECAEEAEALEKLRRGMWVMMRAGSTAPNLNTLISIVKQNPILSARCMAVSDDLSAKDLVYKGHMDEKVRIMVKEGLEPLVALRMVTLSPADYFGLGERGAIGPGKLADMVLVDSLENCNVDKVWKNGRLVVDGGRGVSLDGVSSLQASRAASELLEVNASGANANGANAHGANAHGAERLTLESIEVGAPRAGMKLRVIEVKAGTLTTRTILTSPAVLDGRVVADAERDIAKIVVRERHRDTGRFAVGFVSGMEMTRGAIASSVAHDAHNFVAVGMDDQSIITAMTYLEENGGGLAVTSGLEVLGYFALPVAGLMTTLDAASAAEALDDMEKAASSLGVGIANPFMALSFMSLSVIPELKITDRGYIDITKCGNLPLFSK